MASPLTSSPLRHWRLSSPSHLHSSALHPTNLAGDGKINYLEFIAAFRIGAPKPMDIAAAAAPTHAEELAAAPAGTEAIDMLLEHLCTLFYRHRWSLKHAFEYFDVRAARRAHHRTPRIAADCFCSPALPHLTPRALPRPLATLPHLPPPPPAPPSCQPSCRRQANSDGVLTPEEFSTALTALSSLAEDTMSDGEASSFEALRLTPQQTETLVASLDRNADGVIDYEEFLVALQARDTMQM